jgi:putative flippase GtrA
MLDASARRQFLRYAFVGLSSNALLYLAYLVFTALGMGPRLAMTILYVVGVSATFLINRKWSFNHQGLGRSAFIRYVLAYVAGYLINLGLLSYGVGQLGLPHQAVQATAIVVVACSLFLMHRYWVFAPPVVPEGR